MTSSSSVCPLRPSLIALSLLLVALPAAAQSERDVGAAIGGGAIGAYSGVTLGLLSAVAPCSLSVRGTRCTRIASALGALAGTTSGAVLGYHDPGALQGRLVGGGIGAVAGLGVGLTARTIIPQLAWRDVAAVAAAGGAVGTAPVGAAVGLGAGLVVGHLLWLVLPDFRLPHVGVAGGVGLTVGALLDWAYSAASEARDPRPFVAQLTVTF